MHTTLKERPKKSISEDVTDRENSDCSRSKEPAAHLPVHWVCLGKKKNQDPGNPKPQECFSVHKQPPQSGGSEQK